MKKWEYKRIQARATSLSELDIVLPKLGREGWEVVSTVLSMDKPDTFSFNHTAYVHLFLKREIED